MRLGLLGERSTPPDRSHRRSLGGMWLRHEHCGYGSKGDRVVAGVKTRMLWMLLLRWKPIDATALRAERVAINGSGISNVDSQTS